MLVREYQCEELKRKRNNLGFELLVYIGYVKSWESFSAVTDFRTRF